MQNDVTSRRFGLLLIVEFMAEDVLPGWSQGMGFNALGTAFFLTAFKTAADVAISRDWVQASDDPRWREWLWHRVLRLRGLWSGCCVLPRPWMEARNQASHRRSDAHAGSAIYLGNL